MALIIDKNCFDKHNLSVPKTYDDLLKSEYKNLIAIPDPKTSGTGYAFYLNVVNIMGEDKAIEYFKKLKNNLRELSKLEICESKLFLFSMIISMLSANCDSLFIDLDITISLVRHLVNRVWVENVDDSEFTSTKLFFVNL